MKRGVVFLLFYLLVSHAFAQYGAVLPGGIQVPEVADLNAVNNPREGMIVYETDQKSLFLRREGSWEALSEPVPNNEPHIFVEFRGGVSPIPGDVENKGMHSAESRVLRLDLNFFRTQGSGRVLGYSDYKFTFKKKLGKSSPLLNDAVLRGVIFSDVNFTFYLRANKGDVPYYKYSLKNVVITSMNTGGSDSELMTLIDPVDMLSAKSMIEEMELYFESITIDDMINNTKVTWDFSSGTAGE